MLANRQNFQVEHFQFSPSSKITYSQGTDVSEPLPLSKQISLSECASFESLPDTLSPNTDHQLFARYLFAINTHAEQHAFNELKNHLQRLEDQDPSQLLSLKFYPQAPYSLHDKILEHYIQGWLLYMGYNSSSNKKYFISKARILGGTEHIQTLTRIYKDPKLLGLNRNQLTHFLLNTCLNGWQYFIQFIITRTLQLYKTQTQKV